MIIYISFKHLLTKDRSSHPEVFLGKGVLKICSKFTGEHPYRSVISIKLRNYTSAWVFSCKFAVYFYNTFSYEHFWMAASKKNDFNTAKVIFCDVIEFSSRINNILLKLLSFWKKLFFKISQNSQENICVRVSFLIKLQT